MSIELITPSVQFVDGVNGFHIMRKLEKCARTCYQSEFKQHTKPTADFLREIIKSGHTSVLEHQSVTVDVITSRDVLAEWTRHRIGVGYSVESTRYVNYSKGVEFIIPVEYDKNAKVFPDGKALDIRYKIFQEACETAAYAYNQLIKNGAKPQEARAVLPQALKVNMKVTMNIRAWRHFFELRCASSAHPNIREIAIAILLEFRKKMLPLFEDIRYDEEFYINHKARIDNIFHVPTKETMQTSNKPILNLSKDDYEEYMKATEKEKIDKMTAAMELDKDAKDKPEFEQMDPNQLIDMLFDNKTPYKEQLKEQLFEDMGYMKSLHDPIEIFYDWFGL
jgi:thymidylate synthase (FAD)